MYGCRLGLGMHARLQARPPRYACTVTVAGALLCFDSNLDYEAKQFEAVPHPPVRAMAYAGGMGMFGF